MTVNLCPCMPLEKGCQLLAIIDAAISFANMGLLILAFVGVMVLTEKEKVHLNERERNIALIVIAVAIVMSILQILMALRLYLGVKNRDRKNIRIWLIVSTITVIINTLSLIINSSVGDLNGIYIGSTLSTLLYKIYEVLVVFAFYKHYIKGEGTPPRRGVPRVSIALATITQPQLYNPSPSSQPQHHVYATQQLGHALGPAPTPTYSNFQGQDVVDDQDQDDEYYGNAQSLC